MLPGECFSSTREEVDLCGETLISEESLLFRTKNCWKEAVALKRGIGEAYHV
jgi:hypothetical protein